MYVFNKSNKTRREARLPFGFLMNSLARMISLLEHSRHLSQQDTMSMFTSVQYKFGIGSHHPRGSPDPTYSLLSFHQNPRESLSDFILRIKMSLERKISNPTARDLLLKLIVWEGMTSESRLACQGLWEEHHDRWIVATQEIGIASHQVSSMAQAFVAAVKTEGICFKCGEARHWKTECPQNSPPITDSNPSKPICSPYRKGFHWMKHCTAP